jgi:hypothetical protein
MSSFNESVGLGYLKTHAIEFVKYPYVISRMRDQCPFDLVGFLKIDQWLLCKFDCKVNKILCVKIYDTR